jgi:hypothetical protein
VLTVKWHGNTDSDPFVRGRRGPSDAIENALSLIEGRAAEVIRMIDKGTWPLPRRRRRTLPSSLLSNTCEARDSEHRSKTSPTALPTRCTTCRKWAAFSTLCGPDPTLSDLANMAPVARASSAPIRSNHSPALVLEIAIGKAAQMCGP